MQTDTRTKTQIRLYAHRADGPVRHGLEEGTGGKYLRQGKQLTQEKL